jgi:hypothetical protein
MGRCAEIFERLAKCREKLGDVAHLFVGLQTDADDVFILEEIQYDGDEGVGLAPVFSPLERIFENY